MQYIYCNVRLSTGDGLPQLSLVPVKGFFPHNPHILWIFALATVTFGRLEALEDDFMKR